MTLPDERTRAVLRMERAATQLLPYSVGMGNAEARVPRALLLELLGALRHYPTRYDLDRSAEALPAVWGPANKD